MGSVPGVLETSSISESLSSISSDMTFLEAFDVEGTAPTCPESEEDDIFMEGCGS